tara:strand:+ start:2940 stop:3197 length:258 start_codon:yes stop_codon:yes gene_type:complete
LTNFSKEFYHWLLVGHYEAQRFSKSLLPARIEKARSGGFSYIFSCCKAKSIRFSDLINIRRPFGFAQKSALRLGCIVASICYTQV